MTREDAAFLISRVISMYVTLIFLRGFVKFSYYLFYFTAPKAKGDFGEIFMDLVAAELPLVSNTIVSFVAAVVFWFKAEKIAKLIAGKKSSES